MKPYVEFNRKKRTESEPKKKENGGKDGKALYKLMNNTVYRKTMENMRNRNDKSFASKRKDYSKWASKLSYMSQKIFDNYLVAMPKIVVTLKLVGMCMLDLCKVLMYEFHYDYIKKKYGGNSKLSLIMRVWCMKLKRKMFIKILVRIKKCLTLVIIQLSQDIVMIQTNK